ncbi:hypothetical protein M408DRAFT_29019 [Serendipita vermifera MAFF 305830]|uniref:F-box domain-containing protein n=1 Tax=Serendipita vermifera MAFF 305830 TaxID=933852 RepID=A0A0C3AS48_SERVB|nr:hypothetical protein M408DRAFT_29019 [Serendipita vermifera MAFF 305830]
MRHPIDTNLVPTTEDIENSKYAIEEIEGEIRDLKARLSQLRRELDTHKAWIAPIRRLPFDILSYIFEYCSKQDWRSPLSIAAVSQVWRETILGSPRAWSYVDLRECHSDDLTSLFFQRSGQYLFHVYLPDNRPFKTLLSIVDRLECLSISAFISGMGGLSFPNVKRLSVRDGDTPIDLDAINSSRFPVLRQLACASDFTNDLHPLHEGSWSIAPLEILSIAVAPQSSWLKVIQGCSRSIKSLKIDCYISEISLQPPPRLTFPALEYLEIVMKMLGGELPLALSTPHLEVYEEHSQNTLDTCPLHQDLRTVKQARFYQTPNLTSFAQLCILQLGGWSGIDAVVSQLLTDPSLCPELDLIQVPRFLSLKNHISTLDNLNKEGVRHISIETIPVWAMCHPNAVNAYRCGPDAVCFTDLANQWG